jgi:leucyl aminopeptidase
MTLTLSFAKTPKPKTDTAVICVFDKKKLDAAGEDLNKKTKGFIADALDGNTSFDGKPGQVFRITLPRGNGFRQVILLGAGAPGKLDDVAAETLGGHLYPALAAAGSTRAALFTPHHKDTPLKSPDLAANIAFGVRLRAYAFMKYKTLKKKENAKATLGDITFITAAKDAAAKSFKARDAVAQGVYLARDVMNEPPNVLYPGSYAAIISKHLKSLGVEIEILDHKKMEKMGFGAHLCVGIGSARPPCVVIMRWMGAGKSSKKAPLAFVGKGVTFDTGGISIKPAAGMEDMKMDMGGSAAVVGLMKSLALRKAKVNVVGIVGLAENMPSDRAVRPGDIVTSLSGQTVEVFNTDAEGRLVLCDALTYVQRTYKPSHVIDLATLTGAIMVALGMEYCGAFVNNDKLWTQLESASKATGEKLWRMPLDEAYRRAMDGVLSDVNNMGNAGRYGGACTAAGFLERFIEPGTPWAHLDIAGKMMQTKDMPSGPKGGAGFGVKLLNQLVADYFEG